MANELKQMERQDVESAERVRARPVFRPRTDIYETKDSVIVLAEMPGVAPDAVDVTLERRVLTIRGKGSDDTHDGYRQIYAEYGNADYERVFTLSEEIDQERIEASQKNGLLCLTLPKSEKASARRIDVKPS